MKNIIVPLCVLFLFAGLFGADSIHSKFEDYIIIKYLLNEREFKRAESLMDSFLKKHPEDPFILTEKAYLLNDIKNDKDEAIKLLEKSIEIYPEYYYSNYLHALALFSKYSGKGKDRELAGKAVASLKKSLADNKGYYNSYFLLGVILSEIGEFEESNKYFELSNRLNETPEAYFNMSTNYHELEDVDGEIGTYKKILEFSPENTHILNILSRLYIQKKDFKNAAVYLERLTRLKPEDKNLSFKYLYSLFAAGEGEKFMAASDRIDISTSSLLTYARAYILSAKGKLAEAETLLTQTKAKDIQSRMLLAEIYYRKQDYYRGYQILKEINDKDRDDFFYSLLLEVLSNLGLNRKIIEIYNLLENNSSLLKKFSLNEIYTIAFAFANLKESGKAQQAAQRFHKILKESTSELEELIYFLDRFNRSEKIEMEKTKFEPNIFFMINLYKKSGKFDRSISLVNGLIKKKKEEAYYIELSDIYLLQERHKDAEDLLKRLIKKFPSSVLLKNYYAYHLALQNKELESALELSSLTLKEDGESPAYLDTYGFILLKLGRTDESIEYLNKAYEKHPLEPEIIEHVVDYYRINKDYGKIIEIYKKAIDNGVDFKEELIEKIKEIKKIKRIKRLKD